MKVSILRRVADRLTFRRTGICLPPTGKPMFAEEPTPEDERAQSFSTLMNGLKVSRTLDPNMRVHIDTTPARGQGRVIRDLPDGIQPVFNYEIVGDKPRRFVPLKELEAVRIEQEVKSIPAAIRAVTEATKGVNVEVIPDDQIPELDPGYIPPEVIYYGPRACELQEAAQEAMQEVDMRFWENFYRRIRDNRETATFDSDEELLASKGAYTKGYYPICEASTLHPGIVHVTKNDINAVYLVDPYKGVWRTVSATKRFGGAETIGAEQAKGFLNGRY